MKALAARRRHPLARSCCLLLALLVTGGVYAAAGTRARPRPRPQQRERHRTARSSSGELRHLPRLDARAREAGPSLIGVGAAAVDFQVGTGRMPMQMNGPQAPEKPVQFNEEQTPAARRVRRLARPRPGDPRPRSSSTPSRATPANGSELFRTNCAMCHNAVGAGGALTRGKYAPALTESSEQHIYEAMVTGPQSMPVFNDANITPEEKRDIIASCQAVDERLARRRRPRLPRPGLRGPVGPVAVGARPAHRLHRVARSEVLVSDEPEQPATPSTEVTVGTDAANRRRARRAVRQPGPSGAPAPPAPTPTRRRPSAPSARSSSCSCISSLGTLSRIVAYFVWSRRTARSRSHPAVDAADRPRPGVSLLGIGIGACTGPRP